jgi:hypothetical protein
LFDKSEKGNDERKKGNGCECPPKLPLLSNLILALKINLIGAISTN